MTSVLRCASCFRRKDPPHPSSLLPPSLLPHWGKRIIWLLLLILCVQRLTFDFLLHGCRLLSADGGRGPTATNCPRSSAGLPDLHTLRNTGPPQSVLIGGHDRREQWTCVFVRSRAPAGRPTQGEWRGNCADGGQSCSAHILLRPSRPVIPSPRRHGRGLNVLLFSTFAKRMSSTSVPSVENDFEGTAGLSQEAEDAVAPNPQGGRLM